MNHIAFWFYIQYTNDSGPIFISIGITKELRHDDGNLLKWGCSCWWGSLVINFTLFRYSLMTSVSTMSAFIKLSIKHRSYISNSHMPSALKNYGHRTMCNNLLAKIKNSKIQNLFLGQNLPSQSDKKLCHQLEVVMFTWCLRLQSFTWS